MDFCELANCRSMDMNGAMPAPTETLAHELETTLRALLPEGMVVVAAASSCPPQDWADRCPAEAAHVAKAVASRRDEFHTSRECARACLNVLGFGAVELPPDPEGLPVWPEGLSGSIAHSRGLCLAVLALSRLCPVIGADLERVDRMSKAAAARVVHPDERAFASDDQGRATVLFSLKEAFFKCQYPRWRAQPGFQDLAFDIDSGAGRARVRWIRGDLPEAVRTAAAAMEFRFAFAGRYVASLAWAQPSTESR